MMDPVVDGEFKIPEDVQYRLLLVTQGASIAKKIQRNVLKDIQHGYTEEVLGAAKAIQSAYKKVSRNKKRMKDFLDNEYYEAVEFDEVEVGSREWKRLMQDALEIWKDYVWSVYSAEWVVDEEQEWIVWGAD